MAFEQVLSDEDLARDYGWTETGRWVFRDKYLRKAGVPSVVREREGGEVRNGWEPVPGSLTGAETLIDQALQRVAGFWASWGLREGYFADDYEARTFRSEILDDLRRRRAFPNSPQWFNAGLWWAYGIDQGGDAFALDGSAAGPEHAQIHACFIQSVEDDLCGERGIADLIGREAAVFKGGSGTGTNFSRIRGTGEPLSGGGTSSGLPSFLHAIDRSAGAIKSGGTTRRSAKMMVLDADHPDVLEVVRWKARGEDEALAMAIGARLLREAGKAQYLPAISLKWNAEASAYAYAQGQNANNSIRANGADLWAAVDAGADWILRRRTDGAVAATLKARDLVREIAEAAWYSADPGVQWDDLIQEWHTSPSLGRIEASNPCVTGDTLVATSQGWRRIDALCDEPFEVIGGDGLPHLIQPAFKTGHRSVVRLRTRGGRSLCLTPDHLVLTLNRGDVQAAYLFHDDLIVVDDAHGRGVDRLLDLTPMGEADVYDLTEPTTEHFVANGIVVHNCSEYLYVDDTACNLASLKISAFLLADARTLNWDALAACAARWATVLDISVSAARYPTQRIAERTRQSRTLGLGLMDLGGTLIRLGIRYDSDEGRRLAACAQATIHGAAGWSSQRWAEALGPVEAWDTDSAHFARVWCKHIAALAGIEFAPPLWPKADGPFRNAQWTVCAPTGTIGLAAGCDTTGCEPLYADGVWKELAGGGRIFLPAPCVDDCPDRAAVVTAASLGWRDHLAMVAALQPFVSGGISKTLNLPSETTVDEIAQIYRTSWEWGVKCVSVYRDGCKHSQVLGGGDPDRKVDALLAEVRKPRRRPVPGVQTATRYSARIGGEAAYFTLACNPAGEPTQLRIEHGSAGSREAAWAEALSKVASLALQYGVPLDALAATLTDVAGDPSGPVVGGSGAVRMAGSVPAWVGREILAGDDMLAPAAPQVTESAEGCPKCGGTLMQTGTCKMCAKCGHSLGGCG